MPQHHRFKVFLTFCLLGLTITVATSVRSQQVSSQTALTQLIAYPKRYLNQEVCFSGRFSAFGSLALDYRPAYRSRSTHVSFMLLRPGTEIPLSELKLAMPIKLAKDSNVLRTVEEGDELSVCGNVFSAELGEPWIDVSSVSYH